MDAELGAKAAKTKARAAVGACKHFGVPEFVDASAARGGPSSGAGTGRPPSSAAAKPGRKLDPFLSHFVRDLVTGRFLELMRLSAGFSESSEDSAGAGAATSGRSSSGAD